MAESQSEAPRCDCKVGESLAAYDLEPLSADLRRRWGGADGESVRDLAQFVNERILERALDGAGVDYLDAETATIYRLVTGDGVTSGARVEKRRQLARDGVDVEGLDDDFVSHQTVYRHLTDCLDAQYERPADDPTAAALEQIRALQNRTVRVTEDRVDRLRRGGHLEGGAYSVIVDLTVTCERCGDHHEVGALLESGGCACGHDAA